MIDVHTLSKDFGGIHALRNVSFRCENGMITGLIGPNGSGKSTLINILTGMTTQSSGTFHAEGRISRTFQDARVWENMSAHEIILLTLRTRNPILSLFSFRRDDKRATELLARVGLTEYANTHARHLSYGQRKLLEIARALATGATTLFFDEPFSGLFPEVIVKVTQILKEERSSGKAIILVEHDMSVIRELCDHAYVLDSGELIAEGTVDTVLRDERVIDAYLGK